MPSPEETKAMQAILDKLNAAQNTQTSTNIVEASDNTQQPAQTANVSPDAQEMYNILYKLQNATTQATTRVVEEVERGERVAIMEDKNTVGVGQFNVVIEDTVVSGFKKKYYHITEHSKPIYSDISLFETAMGIVKQLLTKNDISRINKLLELDTQYGSNLIEAATHKKRSQKLTESAQKDVALAKHSNAVAKMSYIKKQIKSLL